MPFHGFRKAIANKAGQGRLRRFLDDEEGSLLIFSIQIFLVMMVCTGIAIDLVRQEERRALIQNTLDRAVLAAASLSQSLAPDAVVQDYLSKAGLGYLDATPIIEEGDYQEWRRVTINVKDNMPTIFGPLVGVRELAANANSQAEESVGNVEISLVLDISGSMGSTVYVNGVRSTRIAELRKAATAFVGQMFDTVQPASAPPGRLSISMIPYNQQVVLGTNVSSLFNLSTDHTQTTCADVELLPTSSIALGPTTPLLRTMYGDSYDYWGGGSNPYTYSSRLNCAESSAAEVAAFSNDEAALKNKISGLTSGGYTSIDIGARWGLAFLDPATRPVLNSMITKGWASSDLSGRPFNYDDGTLLTEDTAMKVLVLMTDGDNTQAYSTKSTDGTDYFRTGPSGFFSKISSTYFSNNSTVMSNLYYYVAGRASPYYRFYDGRWYSASQVGTLYGISWETVWSKNYTLQYVIQKFLYPPLHSASASNTMTSIYANMAIQSEAAQKDTDLLALCGVAKQKSKGIVIFTVAVDAPDHGASVLKQCATADTYSYDVTAEGLTDAFASIATAINSLRLTN